MTTLSAVNKSVNTHELEQRVKKMYKAVAEFPNKKYHFEMGYSLAKRLGYPAEKLSKIPLSSIASFAGVGYYFDFADLKEGEVVVDLGSGSGMDAFYAANEVGQHGEVIGIDMTKAQLQKSIQLRNEYHFNNLNFIEGYIEKPNIVSGCIDAVISNGVINLSSKKEQVFEEIARILKPGGRLVLSDIITTKRLPPHISCNASLWAACIGGAMQEHDYYDRIEAAGLKINKIKTNPYGFISNGAKNATKDYGIKSVSILAIKA